MVMVYTIAKFREQLREAFNMAEQGKKVVISRYGKSYRLIDESKLPVEALKTSKNIITAKELQTSTKTTTEPTIEPFEGNA